MTRTQHTRWITTYVLAIAAICAFASAGFVQSGTQRVRRDAEPTWRYSGADRAFRSLDHLDPEDVGRPLHSAMVNDTTVLAYWDFGPGCDAQGWTSVDRTNAWPGTYFHVDDFAGLGNGFGRLVPIEGNQSLWCGARPSTDVPLCSYAALPGYGNSWDQSFVTADCITIASDVLIDYLISWHSEPGYDYTTLQYDHCDDIWIDIEGGRNVWDGVGSGFYSSDIPDSVHSGQVRLRFHFFSDHVYSDEDALYNTDGAVILDSLTVVDASGIVLPTETFEAEAVGDTAIVSGNWTTGTPPPGYGDFAALFPGGEVLQRVQCESNITCVWGFFSGSTYDYGCAGYPEQAVVPRQNERGQYIWNEIWSPWIPLTGGETAELVFDVYHDLPVNPLVFYVWHVRTRGADMCTGPWRDRDWVYYDMGRPKQWVRKIESVSDLVDSGATEIQVALGVKDMCPFWCGIFGSGGCPSNAPLFDNVEVRTIDTVGPQWSVRDIDLFQDTFASDGTTTGTARVDAAIDLIDENWNPTIRPGDSTAVSAFDLEHGLATDPYTGTGPAVYAYVSIWNGVDPYSGSEITDDPRWPVVDSLVHYNYRLRSTRTWYCVRMDTAFGDEGPEPNRFCVDLNDSLFVPGDTIFFFFGAVSAAPGGQATYWSPFTGTTLSMTDALNDPDECTILPATGWKNGGEILYVDGFNGLGAQVFFETAFGGSGYGDWVDRYDIRGPRELAGNGPGARVVDVSQQLLPGYRAIIWNTGDIENGTIGDGQYSISSKTKSNDAGMLREFLDGLQQNGGIFFSGDNIAEEWPQLTGDAIPLRDTYIQHNLVSGDHRAHGLRNWPAVIGEPGGGYNHVGGPDTTYAFSRCPEYTNFDVLAPTAASEQWLRYDDASLGSNGAAIAQATMNPNGNTVRVVLWGFSLHSIRDDRAPSEMDRFHLLYDTITSLGFTLPIASPARSHAIDHLAQNVPNPFNPVTAIEFSVKERTPVTLRIYNVRGQLVTTLVDDTRAPGIAHRIEWDGRNDAGQSVASGVYFYRLVTKEFTSTKKMVLLK